MKFDPEARTLTLEPTDCRQCRHYATPGQQARKVKCETCDGTGRGPRGGRGKCRPCFGSGRSYDHDITEPCGFCGGDFVGKSSESFTDAAPAEALASLQRRAVFLDRQNTWNEQYLGLGMLFSVTDYGRLHKLVADTEPGDDRRRAAAWAHVEESGQLDSYTQACKVLQPYERGATVAELHDMLVLCITRDGWHVRAMSNIEIDQEV